MHIPVSLFLVPPTVQSLLFFLLSFGAGSDQRFLLKRQAESVFRVENQCNSSHIIVWGNRDDIQNIESAPSLLLSVSRKLTSLPVQIYELRNWVRDVTFRISDVLVRERGIESVSASEGNRSVGRFLTSFRTSCG